MSNTNYDAIATTTIELRSKKLADNVSQNTALFFRLKENGRVRPFSGGRKIVEELFFAENSTFQWYSGYETVDISPSDVITAAEFALKLAAVAVSISGEEMLQNSGPEAFIDLLEARVENAEITMVNKLSSGAYSDGTGDGGKQMGGLQALVADTNTNTVGNIDANLYSYWRNQSFDCSSDGGAAASSANIQSYMNRMYLSCSRGSDHPDLICADNNYFRHYWESLQAIQRISDSKLGQAGFQTLKFMGADVVFDGGQGGDCPTDHMYFLNTKYISLRPHKDRNMVQIGAKRESVNQDAIVKLIGWAGNMTVRNRALQGVIKA